MKQVIVAMAMLCFVPASAQHLFTLKLEDAGYGAVEPGIYGGHLSDFFENCLCYDPNTAGGGVDSIDLCMSLFGALQHNTVRFPSGGNNKYMHPFLGPGYGYKEDDIIDMYDAGWIEYGEVITYLDAIDRQGMIPDSVRYLDRLVDLLWYADSVYGKKPAVIYVAGLTLSRRLPDTYNVVDENLATLRYLDSMGIEIAGVEMGQEHYRDEELFPTFEDYYQHCLPLIDAIRADPDLANVKIALVGALEPDVQAMYELGNVNVSKIWNEALHTKAVEDSTHRFDAYTLHIYDKASFQVSCFLRYTTDYYGSAPDYEIGFDEPDSLLNELWVCGRDSIKEFTDFVLPFMFLRYGSEDSSYCLGTEKEYWITEWGLKPPKDDQLEIDGLLLQGSFNNTFIDAVHTMEYLLALNDINAKEQAHITRVTKHATNAGFVFGSFSHQSRNLDPVDSIFLRRANYLALELVRPLFRGTFRPMYSKVICLDADTSIVSCEDWDHPYIRAYIDNSGEIYDGSGYLCADDSIAISDAHWCWIYWTNATPDSMILVQEALQMKPVGEDTVITPFLSDVVEMTWVRAQQLYSHYGQNSYMMENDYYEDQYVEPNIESAHDTVSLTCAGGQIVLPPYSMGYLKTALIRPEVLADTTVTDTTVTDTTANLIGLTDGLVMVYPNPAAGMLTLQQDRGPALVQLFNVQGQLVYVQRVDAGAQILDLTDIPSGIYMIGCTWPDHPAWRSQVVLE